MNKGKNKKILNIIMQILVTALTFCLLENFDEILAFLKRILNF